MGKLILILSLICITILCLGTALAPQNSAFWLASGTSMYQHVREVLAVVLILQLTTRPPRHLWFRIITATIATAVGIWTIEATYSYHMLYLDTLCFLGTSIAIGVTALERKANTLDVILSNKKALT